MDEETDGTRIYEKQFWGANGLNVKIKIDPKSQAPDTDLDGLIEIKLEDLSSTCWQLDWGGQYPESQRFTEDLLTKSVALRFWGSSEMEMLPDIFEFIAYALKKPQV